MKTRIQLCMHNLEMHVSSIICNLSCAVFVRLLCSPFTEVAYQCFLSLSSEITRKSNHRTNKVKITKNLLKRLDLVFVLYKLAVYLKDSRGGETVRATAQQLFCLG